jgi:hypothetical protein
MFDKLETRTREVADYFLNWDYPSMCVSGVFEELGNDITTQKALAILLEGKFIMMGEIGTTGKVHSKYFALVNPDTNKEMQNEICFNYPDSHVYGNWFTDISLEEKLTHSKEDKIIRDRLYELEINGLVHWRYVFEVEECLENYKYICVNHGNQLLKCEQCRDFTRKLKALVNAGDLDLKEIEKEIFANHVQPWKKERGKKIESRISN